MSYSIGLAKMLYTAGWTVAYHQPCGSWFTRTGSLTVTSCHYLVKPLTTRLVMVTATSWSNATWQHQIQVHKKQEVAFDQLGTINHGKVL